MIFNEDDSCAGGLAGEQFEEEDGQFEYRCSRVIGWYYAKLVKVWVQREVENVRNKTMIRE